MSYESMFLIVSTLLKNRVKLVEKTLREDRIFFEIDSFQNLNTFNVLVDILKINRVLEIEWKSAELMKGMKKVSDGINFEQFYSSTQKDEIEKKEIIDFNANIQKKKFILEQSNLLNEPSFISDLIVVTTLIDSPANLGGIARTCEIFGVKKLIVFNKEVVKDKSFKSLSMSSENWLDIEEIKEENLLSYLKKKRLEKYQLIGAEQTANSVKLNSFSMPYKTVLLLG